MDRSLLKKMKMVHLLKKKILSHKIKYPTDGYFLTRKTLPESGTQQAKQQMVSYESQRRAQNHEKKVPVHVMVFGVISSEGHYYV